MAIMRSVIFTIIGIVAIGWALAAMAPPHWVFGEFFLLSACVLVVREYLLARNQGLKVRGAGNSMVAGGSAWFVDSHLDEPGNKRQTFHPWDFDQAAAKPRTAIAEGFLPAARPVNSSRQSVEQIAHDMLMQAFRQASSKHHPEHGGDPEDMRRVYAARDMILRAIYKP
jgi:hypothetical protein